MTFSLTEASVYDIETFPNCFTLHAEKLHSDVQATWEISFRRDDRLGLFEFFNWHHRTQAPMIGFNNIYFDYEVIHALFMNPNMSVSDIYNVAQRIINSFDRFNTVYPSDRFCPQIDLFKVHHFDNKAKTTSLKALQINMRSPTVVDSPLEFGKALTGEEIDTHLIPYNRHDVKETKRFAQYSMENIQLRIDMMPQISGDVLNFSDAKLGAKLLEQRLGDDICYERMPSGRKVPRQTPRSRIALSDIIFPYIRFNNPEFARVLAWMKTQVLTPEDLDDPDAIIKTKGVFTGVTANVGGIQFFFGTGGIHGSVPAQRVFADEWYVIEDIDVAALYPSIAIVNELAPEHLGGAFSHEYKQLPIERAKYKKGTSQNATFKLGSNAVYGKSNNPFSVFYDPKFPMSITINGQLMLCMLAEWLLTVPTLQIIQINTDGITYRIHKSYVEHARHVAAEWEKFTCLVLERQNYSRMWIRDVNNYIAEDTKGKLKQKGAYWHPDPLNYVESISKASPSSWYKNLSNTVSIRAAIAYMTQGVDPETFIRLCSNSFEFMCRVKVDRASELRLDGRFTQRTTRYYVSTAGGSMVKYSPPPKGAKMGDFRRKNGLSDTEYRRIVETVPQGTWDARIHTKNKSKYETRETQIEAGWRVKVCNDVADFNFADINYQYYVDEAKKLII